MRIVRSSRRFASAWVALLLTVMGAAVLTIAAPADAAVVPIAYEDGYAESLGDTIRVDAPGFLGNDFGVGSGYKAKMTTQWLGSGNLDFNSDGSFTFDPGSSGEGEYDFFYCIVPTSGGDCVSNETIVRMFNGEAFVPSHSYVTTQNTPLAVPDPGLLEGAQNRHTGDFLYITSMPDYGSLDVNADGSFLYVPPAGFIGTATFSYCLSTDDVVPNCISLYGTPGTVSVYPVASPQFFEVLQDTSYSGSLYPSPGGGITFTGALTAAPQHGFVGINADGTFAYRPSAGYSGPDSFAFCISHDGETCVLGSAPATVSISVTPAAIATTVNLTAPASAPYGTPTTIAAQVSPPATGSVAFFDGGTPVAGCAAVPVTAAPALCVASNLAPGPHSFTAAFTGVPPYLGSTGGPALTVVTPAPTALSYSGAPTAVTGAQFAATATLVRSLPAPTPLPGRLLTFSVSGDSCTATTSASGVGSCQLTAPAPGTQSVSVSFAGSATDQPASTIGTLAVSKIATSLQLEALPTSAIDGTPVMLTATLVAGGPGATGTVAFTRGSVPLPGCDAVPLVDAAAACGANTSALAIGSNPITATYSGDATHRVSADTTAVAVSVRPTSLDYVGDVAGVVGEPSTLSAVLSDTTSGLPIAFAPVTFTRGALSCSDITDTAGLATCAVTPTSVSDSGSIAAAYGGAARRGASADDAQLTVSPAPTSTVLAAPLESVFTTEATLVATVSPSNGAGTVAFQLAGAPIAGCAAVTLVDASGSWQATCTTAGLPVGSDELSATFSGTADYVGSTDTAVVDVTRAPTSVQYIGDLTGTVTQPITVSAMLTNTAGEAVPLAGKSLAFSLADLACSAVTDLAGEASCTLTPSDVEQAGTLTVEFAGDGDYLPSMGDAAIEVLPSPTVTVLELPDGGTFSVPLTFTATVEPTSGAGAITFFLDVQQIEGCIELPLTDVDGIWQASCTTDALPVGSNVVTASYTGDPSYLPSASDGEITVEIAPTALAYTGDVQATVGEPLTASAVLTVDTDALQSEPIDGEPVDGQPVDGQPVDGQPVEGEPVGPPVQEQRVIRPAAAFLVNPAAEAPAATIPVPGQVVRFALAGLSCDATTDEDGLASCALMPTSVEQAGSLVATFAGTGDYLPIEATSRIAIAPAQAGIELAASTGAAVQGDSVTLTAVVAPTNGAGTVSFTLAGSALCAPAPLAQGPQGWIAQCTTASLPVGANDIVAQYSGDPSYLGASATSRVVVAALPPAPAASRLASTGADLARPALLGALLVLLGAALTIRRRGAAR